jgi:hypothetical protein
MLMEFLCLSGVARRIYACRRGNTAVEFGLTMPILVLLAFGAYDYGSAYVESVRLNGAARAGAQQALYDPINWDDVALAEQSALEQYVGHALTPEQMTALPVSAAATAFCACTAGVTLACSATCPDGSAPGQFMRVSLTLAVPLTLPYPWADDDQVSVDGEAVVRVH